MPPTNDYKLCRGLLDSPKHTDSQRKTLSMRQVPVENRLFETLVWLLVFWRTERSGTELNGDTLLNNSQWKSVSSREVINAIYSVKQYVNLATIFIIIINNDLQETSRL